MTLPDWLSSLANVAAVITGIVAAGASVNVLYRRRARRIRLEQYLKAERDDRFGDTGIRNIVHLMGNCSMTEAQVLEAAFASGKIKSWVAKDGENGPDAVLMFQFDEQAWQQRQRRRTISKKPKSPN